MKDFEIDITTIPVQEYKYSAAPAPEPQTLQTEESKGVQPDAPTWEETKPVVNPKFSVRQLSDLKESFTGPDLLQWIPDEKFREGIRMNLDKAENPEYEKKKWAVAAFHSQLLKERAGYCYGQMDSINKAYFGKETSVEEAFEEIRKTFTPEENSPHWEAFKQGAYELGLKLDGLALGATRLAAYQYKPYFSLLGLNDKYDAFQKFLGDIEDGMRSQARVEREIAANKIKANPDFITDLLTGDFDKVSLSDFTKTLAMAVPDQAFQLFLASMPGGIVTLPAYVGITTMQEKEFDVRQDHPEWGAAKKWSYVALNGLNEALFEVVTAKIIGKAIKPEQGVKIIKQGLMKFLGKSFLKEGGTEAAQQFDSNVLDILYDVKGDLSALSGAEITRRLFSGVLEEFAVGGTFGTGFGFSGWSNARKVASVYSEIRKRNQDEAALLSKKENRTPAEENRLSRAKAILDTADPVSAIRADHINRTVNAQEEAGEIIESQEYKTLLENYPDLSEEDAFRVVADKRRLDVLAAAEYSIEDLAAEVEDFSKSVKNLTFHVIEDMSSAPQEVQKAKESRNYSNTPAFWHNGEIYINAASKIAPHEVRKFLLHEVVGHEGIRRVVPENQLNSMLDNLFAEHSDDQEFAELAGRYFRGKVSTTEEGEITYDLTVDEQREAAEEYIAYIAQRDIKPSWWKQFIQAVRTFFKGFYSLDMSDSDIETLIGRAAAKTRRRAWSRHSSEVVTDGNGLERTGTDGNGLERTGTDGRARFLVDEEGNQLFNVQGYGQMAITDIINNKLISAETEILTDSGNNIWGKISEQMAKAGKKFNLESLPIKLLKGNNWFGLVHIYKHLSDFPNQDLSRLMGLVFGDIDKICARNDAGHIKLEIFPPKARYWGILELRRQDGYYSVVSFYTRKQQNEYPKGEKIWVRSPQSATSQATSDQSNLNDTSGKMLQEPQTELTAQTIDNINPLQIDVKSNSEKNTRFSVAPVWTGSAADYEQPSLQYIGTGEGAQVFGWGLYGSERRDVAEWYAKKDVFSKKRGEHLYDVYQDGKKIDYSDDDVSNTVLAAVWLLSTSDNTQTGPIDQRVKELLQNKLSEALEGNEDESAINLFKSALSMIDEVKIVPSRNLYKQTFWADKEENLLDWDKPLTEKQVQQIAEQGKKENLPFVYEDNGKVIFNESTQSGKWVYETLCKPYNGLGSPKAVSEFLYRAGIDGVTYIGGSSGVRNYVAFSDKDIRVDEHIRFAVAPEETEWEKAVISVLRPIVGESVEMDKAEIAAKVKELYGLDLSPDDANLYAYLAAAENRKANASRQIAANKKRAFEYFEDLHNYFYHFRLSGEGLFINPGKEFEGEEVSGTFISENFRKYSVKRRQRKNESDKQYRKYLQKRREKLDSAEGVSITDLAESYARATGGDAKTIENEMFDFFRDLTVKDILSAYKKHKQELLAFDKAEDARLREEFMAQERERIKDEAVAVIESGREVTLDWIRANRKVYDEVYRAIFKKEAPQHVSQKDLDALNAALRQTEGDASSYAKAFQEGREKSFNEFQKRLRELREKVLKAKNDTVAMQREALAFAEENLPPEMRSEFTRKIINLLQYSGEPTKEYPQGHRDFAFRQLIREMTDKSATARKKADLDSIAKLLHDYRVIRQYKGIPVSKAPSVQRDITEITRIFRMSPSVLAIYRAKLAADIANSDEGDAAYIAAREKLALADIFGDLPNREANAARNAGVFLDHLVTTGKKEFKTRLKSRLEALEAMRRKVRENLAGSVIDTRSDVDAKRFNSEFLRNRATLQSLLALTTGKNIQDFDNSLQATFVDRYEAAQEKERTANRILDKEVRQAVEDILGYKNSPAGWQKFLNEINEVKEHSGVWKTLYKVKDKKKNNLIIGRRPAVRTKVSWLIASHVLDEHGDAVDGIYGFEGYREETKHILSQQGDLKDDFAIFSINGKNICYTVDYQTKTVTSFPVKNLASFSKISFRPIDGVSRRFARRQADDLAAGIEPVKAEFADAADDAAFTALQSDGKEFYEVEFITPFDSEETPDEIKNLTIGRALQLILEYEQESYKDTFEWNGYTKGTIDQLYQFVGEKYLKFGHWMRDYIQKHSNELDELAKKKYGVGLPRIENYWMGAFAGKKQDIKEQNELFAGAGSMSLNPSFLIARRGHLKPPETDVDAFSMFLRHVTEQNHFLAASDIVSDLKGVFNDSAVKNSINQTLGKNVAQEILDRIGIYAANGARDDRAGAFILSLNRYWASSKILFSVPSAMKQYMGGVAFAYNVPLKDFVRYSSEAAVWSKDFREFYRKAYKSNFIQNRLAGGLDKDLVYLLNRTIDSKHYNVYFNLALEAGSLPTRYADLLSSIQWGYSVYAYTKKEAIRQGFDEAAAENKAVAAWQRAVNETQQSSYLTSQNFYMAHPGFYRAFTAFRSNPIQTMDLVLRSIDEIRLGGATQAAKKKLLRRLLVSHVLIPVNMFIVTQAFRHGFDVDEWDYDELAVAMLFGSFEGLLYGVFIKSAVEKIAAYIADGKAALSRSAAGGSSLDDAVAAAGTLTRLLGDDDISASDIANGVKALGDVISVSGTSAAPIGAVLSALGMRSRQIFRLFEDRGRR